jgi:hypothetical protein
LDETRQALAESTKIVGDTQKDLAQTRLDRDSVREQNGILAEHLNRARSTVSSLEALNTQYRQKFESLSEVLNKPLISIAA